MGRTTDRPDSPADARTHDRAHGRTVRSPGHAALTAGLAAALLSTSVVVAAPSSAHARAADRSAAAAPAEAVRTASMSATASAAASSKKSASRILRRGDRGPAVLAVQKRLAELGYWLGTPDGRYGGLTEQAVFAVQKAAGLRRDGRVGPATKAALDRGVRPTARTTKGNAVEIDLARQLLLVVRTGRVVTVLNTSTGTGKAYVSPSGRHLVADTPKGTFRVSWSYNGWRNAELGRLYRPRYFHPRGIAVHGASSVPPQPASHGCARVSVAAMDLVWRKGWMPVGSKVVVR